MVAYDSNVFIYFLERNEEFFTAATRALQPMVEQREQAVISVLVATEILNGNPVADLTLLEQPFLSIVEVSRPVAELAGRLRAEFPALRTVDALHLATAKHAGATKFVTNDRHLYNLSLGLEIVPLSSCEDVPQWPK